MPLLIVVAVVLIGGITWRARATRRLTIEESVDNYRRTLSAVHEAATRSRDNEGDRPQRSSDAGRARDRIGIRFGPSPTRHYAAPRSRRRLIVIAMGAATVVAVVLVGATLKHGGSNHAATAPTTTRPQVAHPRATTTTTVAAPTTTVALLTRDTTGTQFTIGKPSYTLTVQITSGACWIDMRTPAGAALFTGTLAAGASHSVTANAVTLKLGNPAAAQVSVEGAPVAFTIARGSPVTLRFQGTPAA